MYSICQVPVPYYLPTIWSILWSFTSLSNNNGWSCCSALIPFDLLLWKHIENYLHVNMLSARAWFYRPVLPIDVYDPDSHDLGLTCD